MKDKSGSENPNRDSEQRGAAGREEGGIKRARPRRQKAASTRAPCEQPGKQKEAERHGRRKAGKTGKIQRCGGMRTRPALPTHKAVEGAKDRQHHRYAWEIHSRSEVNRRRKSNIKQKVPHNRKTKASKPRSRQKVERTQEVGLGEKPHLTLRVEIPRQRSPRGSEVPMENETKEHREHRARARMRHRCRKGIWEKSKHRVYKQVAERAGRWEKTLMWSD